MLFQVHELKTCPSVLMQASLFLAPPPPSPSCSPPLWPWWCSRPRWSAPRPSLPPSLPPFTQPPSVAMVVQSASMERSKAVFHRPISLTDDDKKRSEVGGGEGEGREGRRAGVRAGGSSLHD